MFLLKKYTIKEKSILVAFLLCVAGIFYYSWLPNPRFETETYLPLWLRNWSNTYFNLRTAIPFIPLGYLLSAWTSVSSSLFSVKWRFPLWINNTLIATVIICLAEGGQFFIKNRSPDILDLVFGILGSFCGSVSHYCVTNFIKLIFIKHA